MDGEEFGKYIGKPAAIGTTLGVVSSFGNGAMPHPHNPVAHLSAHGGRIATDAFRHGLQNGSTILQAAGLGAGAVGTAALGGVSAAASATVATVAATAVAAGTVAVAAAPFVAVGAVAYGLYRLFKD